MILFRSGAAAAVLMGASILPSVSAQETKAEPPKGLYPPGKAQRLESPPNSAARGAQLVMMGGCHDCHTPKLPSGEPDMSRAFAGHPEGGPLPEGIEGTITTNMHLTAWQGPWGLTLTRNLTPDKETGIGTWTMADFKKTIRTGINPKGEVLYPPMPIPMYQNLPDEDLEAIFNHLRTLKPIRNNVRGRALAPPPPAK